MLSVITTLTGKEREEILGKAEEAEKIIRGSRRALLNNKQYSFYARLALFLELKPTFDWLPTAATDGIHYYYNPEFIVGMSENRLKTIKSRLEEFDKLGMIDTTKYTVDEIHEKIAKMYKRKTKSEVKFLTIHETEHIVKRHMGRCGSRDANLWNIASDHSINTTAVKVLYNGDKDAAVRANPFLEDACVDMKYLDWTSEQIYKDLLDNKDNNKSNTGTTLDTHMGDGSGESTEISDDLKDIINQALGIKPQGKPKIDKDTENAIDVKTKNNIKSASKQAGSGTPEHVQKLIKQFDEAKIDYKQYLRKSLVSLLPSQDECYSRVNKRSLVLTQYCKKKKIIAPNQSIVLAGKLPEQTVDVTVAIDTSGSISDNQIRTVLSEISGITRQFSTFRLNAYCWDWIAYDIHTYTSTNVNELRNFPIVGRGGTNLTSAFEKLDKELPKSESIIVFTDNYVEKVPKEYVDKYGDKTIFIVLSNKGSKAQFGTTINYDDLFGDS